MILIFITILRKKYNDENESDNEEISEHYQKCVNIIKLYDIDIYNSETFDIKNKGCGENILFAFHCGKNNYKFLIRYMFGCSQCCRSLFINKVQDMNTLEYIDVNCDIDSNYKYVKFENFLMLINSPNINKFQELRYGHFLKLNGYRVILDQYDIKNKAHINDHDFSFIIRIINDKGSYNVIPYFNYYDPNKYVLYICPTLEFVNAKSAQQYADDKDHYHYLRTRIDINMFHQDLENNSWYINYDSDNYFINLTKAIDEYLDYINRNSIFQDEKTIKEFVKSFREILNIKITKKQNYDNDNDIDLFISYFPDKTLFDKNNIIFNTEYPFDFYGIHFYYNKNIDKDYIFSIQGLYYDITTLVNDYNKEIENFDINNYDLNIKNIHPKYVFKSSFSECFDQLKYFINKILSV